MKDAKEISIEQTDWDSNRECFKFDKQANIEVQQK